MSILVADIETDGLKPSQIWVVGIIDYETGEFDAYTHPDDNLAEGLLRLLEAEMVIFHNGLDYDVPVIRRLTEGLVEIDREKVYDTLIEGRRILREIPDVEVKSHKLADWGTVFNVPKIDFNEWESYDPRMVPRCKRDCEITKLLFDFLLELDS